MKNIEIPKGFKVKNSKVVGEGDERVIVSEIVKDEVCDELMIEVIDGCLHVSYKRTTILCIDRQGKMSALDCDPSRKYYVDWVEDGMRISSESVEWRGECYSLSPTYSLMNNSKATEIFDFEHAQSCINCKDDHIKRYKHNDTPILF